jgi:hypothetical protein
MQEAIDRRLAGLEHVGDFAGTETEHVAQHEHRSLLRREVLEPRDKGQRRRFLGLVAGVRTRGVVGDAVEQDVGVGLEPDRLGAACRLGDRRHSPGLLRAASARPQRVERTVGRDPVQPGADGGAPLEPLEPAPCGEQRLLDQVLGVLGRPDDAVDVLLELTPVRVGQLSERILVAGARAGERPLGHARNPPPPPLPWMVITSNDPSRARNSPLSFRPGERLNSHTRLPPAPRVAMTVSK